MNRPLFHLLSGPLGADLEIRILMRLTARAFGVKEPKKAGLRRYAKFSAAAARHALWGGEDLKRLHRELFRRACRLGRILRRCLRPRNEAECRDLVGQLYRNIGIVIREESPGRFCVPVCYFSAFYTPEICSVISAIDRGLFAGIYPGSRLTFRERMTEGRPACLAQNVPF